MKKSYNVEVDCANCANEMEKSASKVNGVKEVSINFMAQKLTVEFNDGADEKAVMKEVVKACKKIERDFIIEL
ncbi:MAG: heavy-metal-associated domain-containing protein [Clostridia bacterium]|nr:heavy-metal-associated domain-containing protein [Clostridia bacterium]